MTACGIEQKLFKECSYAQYAELSLGMCVHCMHAGVMLISLLHLQHSFTFLPPSLPPSCQPVSCPVICITALLCTMSGAYNCHGL